LGMEKMQWIKAMQFKFQSCDKSSVPHSRTCPEEVAVLMITGGRESL